jgi:hypothetical protein
MRPFVPTDPKVSATPSCYRFLAGLSGICTTAIRRGHSLPNIGKVDAMTIIKAAAVQISPVLYSREGTVNRVVSKIIELGREGVRFATFPETVVPYYPYFSFVLRPFEIYAETRGYLNRR